MWFVDALTHYRIIYIRGRAGLTPLLLRRVHRLIRAVDRLNHFPKSGRAVPEFEHQAVREIIERPYRIIYRIVADDEVHILTIYHSARSLPDSP